MLNHIVHQCSFPVCDFLLLHGTPFKSLSINYILAFCITSQMLPPVAVQKMAIVRSLEIKATTGQAAYVIWLQYNYDIHRNELSYKQIRSVH